MNRFRIMTGVGLGLALGLALASSASASSNLITNGGFEQVGNGTFSGAPDGVVGWSLAGTVGDGYLPVDIAYGQASGYPTGAQGESVPTDNAPSLLGSSGTNDYGVYFVTDQAHGLSIYQEVYLTPGSYDIGFDSYFTNNGFDQPGDADLTATIAGVALADIDLDGVTPGVWTTHQGEAKITTAGDYLVSFAFSTPDEPQNAKDVVIDQVYVIGSGDGGGTPISAAPEPSTWLLMLTSIGGIGLMLRRATATRGRRSNDGSEVGEPS